MKITELITYIKTNKKCITSFLQLFVNMDILRIQNQLSLLLLQFVHPFFIKWLD